MSKGFFSEALSPGKLLLITATMRAGKSSTAGYIIEKGIPLGYNFYTNMIFFDYEEIDEAIDEGILKQKKEYYHRVPQQVHTKTKMSELILGLYQTRKNITLLDEALLFASSKKGSSRDIRWFEGFVTQIGKMNSSIILISQAKSKLATLLKEDIPSYELKVKKISFSNRYVEVWYNPGQNREEGNESRQVDTWYHVPPTHLPYDTLAPAGLEYDIDMERFINSISKLNSLKVRKVIPDMIKKELEEKTKNGESKKDIIVGLIQDNPDITTGQIMEKLNELGLRTAVNYITRIKREIGVFS